MKLSRRSALGLGTAAAATAAVGITARANAAQAPQGTASSPERKVARVYTREVAKAQGVWSSLITVGGTTAVEQDADKVVEAYSVNKLAVATAVLDKIDRGLLTLDQRVDLTAGIVIQDIDGTFALDRAYPSSITLGHVMANLLSVSDNTAVRLCGLVCPAAELNQILRDKGFVATQVVPVANPNRFFLGQTTPRETHTLLSKLVAGELLSATSTDYLLNVIRSTSAFTDGIRLRLRTDERLRVGTKAGWFDDGGRNEAGVVFAADGTPGAIYSLFASGPFAGDATVNDVDFGATHPALKARQELGRALVDVVDGVAPAPQAKAATKKYPAPGIVVSNGG
ncbi:serine hydrolase [Actinophytocola sp.]|uniref:serine hydrolase n=1 Tax=Actinophytocola sp. TaxID=1872138 RepID=UPI003899D614